MEFTYTKATYKPWLRHTYFVKDNFGRMFIVILASKYGDMIYNQSLFSPFGCDSAI
jgi:hypothetical protein